MRAHLSTGAMAPAAAASSAMACDLRVPVARVGAVSSCRNGVVLTYQSSKIRTIAAGLRLPGLESSEQQHHGDADMKNNALLNGSLDLVGERLLCGCRRTACQTCITVMHLDAAVVTDVC
jgi:hypothetical protein